jgi:hypothetical protein
MEDAYTEAKPSTMTALFTTQIELDERDVAWIAGTKVEVVEVVPDRIAYGSSRRSIFNIRISHRIRSTAP